MFKQKNFRLVWYESSAFLAIQQRVCFIWITLVDDDSQPMKFPNVVAAEEYLHQQKKFGESYTIVYKKVVS